MKGVVGPIAAATVALVCAVNALRGYFADARALAVQAAPLLVLGGLLAAALVAWWVRRLFTEGRAAGMRAEATWSRAEVVRHEDGHAKLLRRYGVGLAWFDGYSVYQQKDGNWAGYVNPGSWAAFNRLTPEQQIAVYAAGYTAAGHRPVRGSSDEQNIRRVARRAPAGAESRGRALARRDL